MVAPFTGAWIEIGTDAEIWRCIYESHPSRVRGLKSITGSGCSGCSDVAPFTGAWIEIHT